MNYRKCLNVVFSVFFVLGLNYYFFDGNDFGNRSIFNVLLLIYCIIMMNSNINVKYSDKKESFAFSVIFSLSLIVGNVIYKYNDISMLFNNTRSVIHFFITYIGFSAIFNKIFYIIFNKIKNINFVSKANWKIFNNQHSFLLIWILILFSWIPVYLAYYPGVLTYDSAWQTEQALGNTPYTKFHPPLHTFIWQLCLNLGSKINVDPLAIYSILQMLFLSFVFAKVIKLLIDKKSNNYFILISILFYAINPVIAVFSFNMTKDLYFSGFFLLFVLEIVKLLSDPPDYFSSYKKWLPFFITGVFACLLRNNALYVYIIFCFGLILYFRDYLKNILVLCSLPLIFIFIVNNVVYPRIGVEDGKPAEMLSVPIQQISRVVNVRNNELSEKKKMKIDKFLSYDAALNSYNPRYADCVKDTFDSLYFSENKIAFFKLWFNLFIHYPVDYISSFLSLNLPYWYIDASTVDEYSNRVYIETGIYNNEQYISKTRSVFPKLHEKYTHITDYDFAICNPLIVNIFSITMPFWLMLFSTFALLYKKNYKLIMVIFPSFVLWLTYMAGPVSNFRYIFAIFIQYPLFIFLMLYNGKKI